MGCGLTGVFSTTHCRLGAWKRQMDLHEDSIWGPPPSTPNFLSQGFFLEPGLGWKSLLRRIWSEEEQFPLQFPKLSPLTKENRVPFLRISWLNQIQSRRSTKLERWQGPAMPSWHCHSVCVSSKAHSSCKQWCLQPPITRGRGRNPFPGSARTKQPGRPEGPRAPVSTQKGTGH